jgi:hypothetical protein
MQAAVLAVLDICEHMKLMPRQGASLVLVLLCRCASASPCQEPAAEHFKTSSTTQSNCHCPVIAEFLVEEYEGPREEYLSTRLRVFELMLCNSPSNRTRDLQHLTVCIGFKKHSHRWSHLCEALPLLVALYFHCTNHKVESAIFVTT